MKKLNDLTIKDYNTYQELLELTSDKMDNNTLFTIMELFGYTDVEEMDIADMKAAEHHINCQILEEEKIKKHYTLNGKTYKPQLNLMSIKAGQFLDMQSMVAGNNMENILACILLPVKKNWLGKETISKYCDGYDFFQVADDIYNNMRIGDAMALSSFFLSVSQKLLRIMKVFSHRKYLKMKKKEVLKKMHPLKKK